MSASEKIRIEPGRRVGILAGGGALPRVLAEQLTALGYGPFIIAFEGHTDAQTCVGFEHFSARLGATGKVIAELKNQGISDLVLIGSMRRPSLAELKPDLKTLEFFTRMAFKSSGDDALLRGLKSFLEGEGFTIHGVQDFMPQLLAPSGALGKITPNDQATADIRRGREVLAAMAPLDIGQAVVVQNGFVIGIEAAEGTDVLIERCAALMRDGAGGVLVKFPKVGQDRDLDLPTIGPETVEKAAAAGLSGIAVQAGATLIADLAHVIEIADARKIFIMGIEA